MSPIHPDDPLLDALAALAPVLPDAGYAERVRARGRAALHRPGPPVPVALEPVTIGTICALYAWQVLQIAARVPLP